MAVRRILVALALTGLASAQNPWVNRRKNKDKDAPVAADPAAGDTDFSKLNDMVKNLQQAGAAGGQGEDMFAGMGDMWESLMDSPEMEEMLANPELLKATIKNNPLINAIPGASEQVEALLQSDAFNDPAQLKQAMRQGVDAMKAVGSEFGSQLGAQMKLAQQNPEAFKAQMEAMMSQLAGGPEQGRALMEAAKGLWDGSADPAQLEALSKLPGMEALADPEAMKRQMAELQKMMGAGQMPAMGGEL